MSFLVDRTKQGRWWPARRPVHSVLLVLAGWAAALVSPVWGDETVSDLAAHFVSPPAGARPHAYYLWLNGHVDRDQLRQELRQFFLVGVRGLCLFDMGARGDPRFVPPAGPAFLSPAWMNQFADAERTARDIGLELGLSVASSWDMGGDWVRPANASKGIYASGVTVSGPGRREIRLPLPELPPNAPRDEAGRPQFLQEVTLLALPAEQRRDGYPFVFQLDPAGPHRLRRTVLWNPGPATIEKLPGRAAPVRRFALDISMQPPPAGEYREVLRGALGMQAGPQAFELDDCRARYVRLRLLDAHGSDDRPPALAEFSLYDDQGIDVVASHRKDRSRDGAVLLGFPPAAGYDRVWTAGNLNDGATDGPGGCWAAPPWKPLDVSSPDDVIDLSGKLDADGRLVWQVPPGRWLVMRMVCANTGERLKVPSPHSDGLATDHLSHQATREYLQEVIRRLGAKIDDFSNSALRTLYLASYEVRGPIWTSGMVAAFEDYRGYDMRPFLPTLFGHRIGGDEVAARFMYDYRKTLGDLLVDAYYCEAVRVAHRAGLKVEAEAGGPGPPIHQVPVDALKALGALDEVRGEFWPHRPDARHLWVVKETASAAHIYGKRKVHMEAFTSMHHWQDGPFDLKPAADRAFCEGANHLVWHTAAHLPDQAGRPGWVYLAGTHLNSRIVWWRQSRSFLDYLARCSYLLQQGQFVADVLYYYGDHGFNFVEPKHVDPSLGPGYDYDVINRDVLLDRLDVADHRLRLPGGPSYQILVLPHRTDIDPIVLQRVLDLVQRGATVVGERPERATGLGQAATRDRQVRRLATALWGDSTAAQGSRAVGRGHIVWGKPLRAVLADLRVPPDLTIVDGVEAADCDFIHRQLDDGDVYFVRNCSAEPISPTIALRCRRGTPQLWDPVTGKLVRLAVFQQDRRVTTLRLPLAPYGSAFVVFRSQFQAPPRVRVEGPVPADGQPPHALEWTTPSTLQLRVARPGDYRLSLGDTELTRWSMRGPSEPLTVAGPWKIEFQDTQSSRRLTMDRLVSWTAVDDPEVRYFSGTARYSTSFQVPDEWLDDRHQVSLDLGDLWAVAEVKVNERSAGLVWCPPYRVSLTGLVHAGDNKLVVEVANTWSNRLVGDAQPGHAPRHTRTNVTSSAGVPWRDVPLRPSGLFGPVTVQCQFVRRWRLDGAQLGK